MENYYVSTFISGLSSVIEKELTDKINNVQIIKIFDGLIIYKVQNYNNISKLPFFNNTFLLLGLKQNSSSNSFNNEMNSLIERLSINFKNLKNHLNFSKQKSFKIIAIDQNQPIKINYNIVQNLEKDISKNLNIKVNTRKPDLEFIFLRRSEGVMLFMFKLTYNRKTEKFLAKGELRPELAYALASLANLNKNKTVMDPFCGSGSIPKQIVKYFDYNMCFASDSNEELIRKFKNEYKSNKKKLFIKKRDALNLEYFDDEFIDTIVTDPPWNIFEKQDIDFSLFYNKMLVEFARILNKKGNLIILMGNAIDFENALNQTKLFKMNDKLHVLVNGKKANIYVLTKR